MFFFKTRGQCEYLLLSCVFDQSTSNLLLI